MHIASTELQHMVAANGMVLGRGTSGGNIVVNNITDANSAGIERVLTLLATSTSASVVFTNAPSVFSGLSAQAGASVSLDESVTTTESWLWLDGDLDNAGGGINYLADQVTVSAKALLTLQADTGSMVAVGSLSLRAGTGISIETSLAGSTSGKAFVIDADYESQGDGTLTILNSRAVSTEDGLITLTAWDIDLSGELDSGAGIVQLHPSLTSTIGLGSGAAQDFNLDISEFNRLTAHGGFIIEGNQISKTGNITVNGLDVDHTLLGFVTLLANHQGAHISFETSSSTFYQL
jgi:hypothetical protein